MADVDASRPRGGRRPLDLGVGADALAEQGWTVVPFLPADVVADLRAGYQDLVPRGDHGLTVDYMRPDRSTMRAVRRLLEPVWEHYLARLLPDHRPVMTTFVTKHPGPLSGMFLHDDRSYVDERRARAHTLWIPLDDVGPETGNGALQIVPRSHRLATGLAGSLTPDHVRPYEAFLRRRLVTVTAGAGDAVLYDTRTLHASAPNLTDRPRVALACAVAPRNEQLIHVVATGARRRRVHAVTPDFFVEHHPRRIEEAMPADCPVLWEYDDDATLSPERVGEVFATAPPEPDVVLPPDLADDGRAPERLPELGRAPGRVSEAGTVDLAPGARQSCAPPRGRRPWWIRVDEAPLLSAGVLAAGRATNLRSGTWIQIPAAADATVWNDGPGVARVTAISPRSLARPRWRLPDPPGDQAG